MRGGKIISEGAYGCIYNPALQCSKNKETYAYRKRKINKLQLHNEYAENELNIGKIVTSLPDYEARFSPLYHKNKSCTKLKVRQFKNGTLQSCSIMTKQNPDTKVMLLEGNYIKNGESIEDYLESVNNQWDILNALNRIFLYIIQSIQVLGEKQIVHFDLRSPNIIYDTYIKIPIILDFGISFRIKDMFTDYERVFIAYNPKYYIYPPEVLLVTHFIFDKEKDMQYNTSKVYKDCIENKLYTSILPEKYRESYKQELTQFFETLQENKSVDSILKKYSRANYYKTWDVYIFSIFFLKLVQNVYQETTNIYVEEIQYLCYQCLHPNPSKRPSIEDIIIHCEKIQNMFHDENKNIRKLKSRESKSKSFSSAFEDSSLRDSLSM